MAESFEQILFETSVFCTHAYAVTKIHAQNHMIYTNFASGCLLKLMLCACTCTDKAGIRYDVY